MTDYNQERIRFLQQLQSPNWLESIPMRDPYQSELDYFRNNRNVAGMAAEDDAVILNPFSNISDAEKQSVIKNEKARILMRNSANRPSFDLTEKQRAAFGNYGTEQDARETIAARIFSGDPSAQDLTPQQREWVERNLRTQSENYGPASLALNQQLEQDSQGLQDPWIDPVSAFAGGFGGSLPGAIRSIGKEGLKALLRPVASGAAGALADYPIGAATEHIGENYPSLAMPFNIGAGMLAGKLPNVYEQGLPARLQNQIGSIGEIEPEGLVSIFNKTKPGHALKYDGIQEGFGSIPSKYQFTAYEGPAKGATFLVDSLDDKAISKKLNEMIKMRSNSGNLKNLALDKEGKPIVIQATSEDIEINPDKVGMVDKIANMDITTGEIKSGKYGVDDVYNHADIASKYGMNYDNLVTGFLDKKGKFLFQYDDDLKRYLSKQPNTEDKAISKKLNEMIKIRANAKQNLH